jgi:hypothetical protein
MSATLLVLGLGLCGVHAATDWQLPRVKLTRRGGLRFLRIGRWQFSFCKCKESI